MSQETTPEGGGTGDLCEGGFDEVWCGSKINFR